jgi:hypothetical protein
MSYDEYEHAFDGPVRPVRPRTRRGPLDRVATVLLLGVEGLVACGAHIAVILVSEVFNRCQDGGGSCDYGLGDRLFVGARVAVPVLVALSVVGVVVAVSRQARAWWVPVAASAALVALVIVYAGLMDPAAS